jgi:hypothetical protein
VTAPDPFSIEGYWQGTGVALQEADPNVEAFSWELAAFLTGSFGVLCALLAVGVWQFGAVWRSRILVAREAAYQKLAESSADAIAKTAEALDRQAAQLAEQNQELARLRTHSAERERMLKEVG